MKNDRQQIREYKRVVQGTCINKEAEERTIKACRKIIKKQSRQEQSSRASYFEFLYEQSGFIQKRWWLLQGGVLFGMWFWLHSYMTDWTDRMRLLGIAATLFVVLIIPEIWKNKRNGAIEIEQTSYYTLRQICAARMLLFAAVDLLIVMVFLGAAYRTTALSLTDLVTNFLLPVNVSGGICFRTLYSKWEKSEYVAVLLCLVWVAVWMMIVANEAIYQKIAAPVWIGLILLTLAYFIFCIQKSLTFGEKSLEDLTYEIRA